MSRFGLRHRWEPSQRDHRKLLVCDATVGWARQAAERGLEDDPWWGRLTDWFWWLFRSQL